MNDWGFPLMLSLVKDMAAYLVYKEAARQAWVSPLPAAKSGTSLKIQC